MEGCLNIKVIIFISVIRLNNAMNSFLILFRLLLTGLAFGLFLVQQIFPLDFFPSQWIYSLIVLYCLLDNKYFELN